MTDDAIGEIMDYDPGAVKGPAGEITVGCHIFDVCGDRHPVTRVWLGKDSISLARDGESWSTVKWGLDEIVTYVPKGKS